MNEDEVLAAWLIKHGYRLTSAGGQLVLIKQMAYPTTPTAEHLSMWVDRVTGPNPWKIKLYHTQRGKRRRLRSAVREWLFT
jgi:hypothetical protein